MVDPAQGAPVSGGAASARLPRELIFFYLAAPVVLAPLLQRNFFELSPRVMLVAIAGNAVPFLAIPPAIHAVYRFVMPGLLRRLRSLRGRVVSHVVASAATAVAASWIVHPLFMLFSNRGSSMTGYLASSVVITWAFLLPALVVQELRARAEASERRLQEQRQAALRAQLEAIQSRTNPHFLFNALNTVASLLRDQPAEAERTLERLADLLRYALQSASVEWVPLERELEMVRDYLEIQRARFGERLRYTVTVDPRLAEVPVPPLLLQPLAENAVLHGVAGRAGGGRVRVAAVRREDGAAQLLVEDDGPGPGASDHRGSGTSLNDLARRLRLIYGGEASPLTTRAGEDGGFTVEVLLPAGARP
jgi:two-component system sensor histidine kinase AlgZ